MDKDNPLLGRTITIEFFVDFDKRIHVIHNTSKYTFSEFWSKVEHAEKICRLIYEEFKKQFPKKFKKSNSMSHDWKETVIKLINNHLGEYNHILDVMVKSNGSVQINLER